MITQAGMSPALGNIDLASGYDSLSGETKKTIEAEVRQTVELGRQRAMEILLAHRMELDTVANALVEYETLTLDEMKKILKGEKLPRLTSFKQTGIKLPEIVLPPGIGGMSTGGQSGTPGGGGGSNPPESGEGGAKL